MWAPPTKMASAHAWHVTLSTLRHAGGRALDLHAVTGGSEVGACGGRRPPPTSAPARESSSPPRSFWRWGSSGEGHLRSWSPWPGWSQPLILVSKNWPLHVASPQPAMLVGATSRSHLPQCHGLGSPLVRVLSLQQRSPATSTLLTEIVLKQCPLSVKSPGMSFGIWTSQFLPFPLNKSLPGDFLVQPFPHSMELPGDFLPAILRIGTCCSLQSIVNWRSTGSWWNLDSWWSDSTFSSTLPGLQLLQRPIDGCPSWGPSSPYTSHNLQQWTPHMSCSSWQQKPYEDQAREHGLATASVASQVVWRAALAWGVLLLTLGPLGIATLLLSPPICLAWTVYVADRPPSTSHLSLDARGWDEWVPQQWALLRGPSQVMVPFGPIGWHAHAPFGLLPQHAGTSAETDIHDGG